MQDDLPKGWRIIPIKEIFSFLSTNSYSRSDLTYEKDNESVLNIHYGDIHTTFKKTILNVSFFQEIPVIKRSGRIVKGDFLKDGDVIIADASEDYKGVGEAIELRQVGNLKVVSGLHTIALRSKSNLMVNGFKAYSLRHPKVRKSIKTIATGTKVYGISKSNLKDIELFLPTVTEQKSIAAILSTWDQAIDKTQRLIAQMELRKKGLMQELLTGKKRLPGFDGEWKELKYNEIVKEVKRPIDWDDDELYRLISVRRRSGGLFQRDALYGRDILTKNLRTAKAGDYLISKMQIVHGASGMVTEEFDDMKISGSYISLRAKRPEVLDMKFFNWLSKMPYFYHQTFISSYGVHIEKMTFNFKSFLKLKVRIPNLTEQRMIVGILENHDSEIQKRKDYMEKLKIQKKGLMQQLLTGNKRVKY